MIKNESVQDQGMSLGVKDKNIDLSILQHCVGLVKIKSIIPLKAALVKEIINGELQIQINSSLVEYRTVFNMYQSSHVTLI
jgi:hypothetical protein